MIKTERLISSFLASLIFLTVVKTVQSKTYFSSLLSTKSDSNCFLLSPKVSPLMLELNISLDIVLYQSRVVLDKSLYTR